VLTLFTVLLLQAHGKVASTVEVAPDTTIDEIMRMAEVAVCQVDAAADGRIKLSQAGIDIEAGPGKTVATQGVAEGTIDVKFLLQRRWTLW
jgi:hypothetical protein